MKQTVTCLSFRRVFVSYIPIDSFTPMSQVLTTALKQAKNRLSNGVKKGRFVSAWRWEGGKLGQWLLQVNVTKQLNLDFVFDSHLGIGHKSQVVLVLYLYVTLNYL